MTAALLFTHNMMGGLKPPILYRLQALIDNPTQATWEDAHTILITPNLTVWQAVIKIDPTFCRRKKLDARWDRIPTSETIRKAILQSTIPINLN